MPFYPYQPISEVSPMLELLSPAGSPESVVAAVQNGADAIYLGLGGFNARRGAKNFTEEEFVETAQYCRVRGCKVYVTLNTLTSDRELEEAARLARFVSEAGADAVLVQDLGVARALRSVCPDLTLHASTQMSIHNLAGVYAAAELGMKRVVLARELSGEQIRFIAEHSPIEVEVFVHGALCFCHSGQCYLSALIGRRSGNRGMCAQPCRMEYSMGRRMDGHPMSLKDNCLLSHLKELEEMGVACVKIEGRMKRPEYSGIVTRIYARAIHEGIAPTEQDMEQLTMAFSRDGFTDGYFTGKKQDMHGVRAEQPDREANRLFTEVRRSYASGELRRVPVDLYAAVEADKPLRVLAQDDNGHKVSVFGPRPEKAVNAALTQKAVCDQLYKTGGTPYHARTVSATVGEGLFVRAAALNDLRRQALEQLSQQRAAAPERRYGRFPNEPAPAPRRGQTVLTVQVLTAGQLTKELAEQNPALVYVPLPVLEESFSAAEPFLKRDIPVAAVLPRVITDPEMDSVRSMLERVKARGVDTALCGNLGHIALARHCGFAVRGDFGLNVFNSYTLQTLKEAGLLSATASFELRMAQVRDLIKCLDTELIVYGRLPAMVTDQCIISQSAGGCACSQNASLSDKMGSVFPVVKEFGCRNVIYNAHKLFLADKAEDIAAAGLWGARLLFSTESARECVQVMKRYRGESEYTPNGLTRGLYYRGVE